MNENRLKWVGFCVLLLMLVVLCSFMVPAHFVSIWMDPEFTDWVSPIAHRLHGGARLYTDGMHSPMPPLPYAFLRILYPHGAIWINENLLNYAFVSATILLMYLAFTRKSGAVLSFAACSAAIPVFLNLSKTMLYDSMAQFLVVVVAVLCARSVETPEMGSNSLPSRKLLWPMLTGAAAGLLLLTKQSTGVGVVAAAIIVMAFLPAGGLAPGARCRNIFGFLLATVGVFFIVAAALSPYASVSGMLHDVFLFGAEPKGGKRRILSTLLSFASIIGIKMAIAVPIFWAGSAILRRKLNWRAQSADFESVLNSTRSVSGSPLRGQETALLVTVFLTLISALAVVWLPVSPAVIWLYDKTAALKVTEFLLNLGLLACAFLIISIILPALCGSRARLGDHPFAPWAIILLCAALFHNLSVNELRWTYDANPLIVLALIFLLGPFIGGFLKPARGRGWGAATRITLFAAIILYMWILFFPQFKLVQTCTESWPEIPHLAGAKMRPESEGLRQMVKSAQTLADKSKQEQVLMLPDDPNVEAWIDRDRPALSSMILFTDQYWDRYVDRDVESLKAHPPKVIIIGPRRYWLVFSRIWHPDKEEGVIRLIHRVQTELLPAHYELLQTQVIGFKGKEEAMDIYVRRER